MSLEQQIADLTASIQELTDVVQGQSLGNAGTSATVVTPTVSATPPATQPAPIAAVAPVAPAVAPVTPAVVVTPAAASPSEAPITFEQVQQEITAAWQSKNGDPRIMELVGQYGESLSTVPPEHYADLVAAVRAL